MSLRVPPEEEEEFEEMMVEEFGDVTPQRALDMELAERESKRARTEEEEEEEETPLGISELPIELQLAMIETVEAAQRELSPPEAARLSDVSGMWRALYGLWVSGRVAQMKFPPDAETIALARLFTSPRFKLLSAMRWEVAVEMLLAYAGPAMGHRTWDLGRRGVGLLSFLRSATDAKWFSLRVFDSPRTRGEFEGEFAGGRATFAAQALWPDEQALVWEIVFSATPAALPWGSFFHESLPGGGTTWISVLRRSATAAATTSIKPVKIDAFVAYGRVANVLDVGAAITGVRDIDHDRLVGFTALAGAFFASTALGRSPDAGPTNAMLEWKNRIVVARARDVTFSNSDVVYHRVRYVDDEGESNLLWALEWTSHAFDESLRDIVAAAKLAIESERGFVEMVEVWITRTMARSDSDQLIWTKEEGFRFGSGAPALPTATALEVITERMQIVTVDKLARFFGHPQWGYALTRPNPGESGPAKSLKAREFAKTLYMPNTPSVGGSSGLLIMPAPWFFLLTKRFVDEYRFVFGSAHFDVGWGTPDSAIEVLQVDGGQILAHQPYAAIYLRDDISQAELEKLTMLQRSVSPTGAPILERAKGRLEKEEGLLRVPMF